MMLELIKDEDIYIYIYIYNSWLKQNLIFAEMIR